MPPGTEVLELATLAAVDRAHQLSVQALHTLGEARLAFGKAHRGCPKTHLVTGEAHDVFVRAFHACG
jgi:hypothetical protein